nr:single-stranded DNA-binding protein [Lactobacillus johnsonii]
MVYCSSPRQDNRKEADYIRCLAFDKLASAIYKHCDKGRQVLCQGRLQVSKSIDEVTKQVKYHHTVVVSNTIFCTILMYRLHLFKLEYTKKAVRKLLFCFALSSQ